MKPLSDSWKQKKKNVPNRSVCSSPISSNKKELKPIVDSVSPIAGFGNSQLFCDADFLRTIDDLERNHTKQRTETESQQTLQTTTENRFRSTFSDKLGTSIERHASQRFLRRRKPEANQSLRKKTCLKMMDVAESTSSNSKVPPPTTGCDLLMEALESMNNPTRPIEELTKTNKTAETNDDDCFTPPPSSSSSSLLLSSWGLPDPVLERYKECGVQSMYEWQVACLACDGVIGGGNLVYSAPTSSGKTLVAEILMLKCVIERKKKALMILPFVSVTHEKMLYLKKMFGDVGVRVDGFMAQHVPPGGFDKVDIAVCTIEKANGLVNRLLEERNLNQLGIVVVDELHMIGDSSRGYLVELLLAKIRYAQRKCNIASTGLDSQLIQIVGMSATLPNLDLLARWLDAELFCTQFRPVPLTECVKVGLEIKKLHEDGSWEVSRMLKPSPIADDVDHVVQLCVETVADGHGILIFCPFKQWCENLAETIANEFFQLGRDQINIDHGLAHLRDGLRANLNGDILIELLGHLKKSPAGLDKSLLKTVPYGVAFHHAGLTMEEREILESAFRQGTLKVLTATSTLSSGVNLPARRVIVRTPVFHSGTVLDVLIYKQMIGRAGRKGLDDQGESILICKSTEMNKALELMKASLKPVSSCLLNDAHGQCTLSSAMKRGILEIVVSGAASKPNELDMYTECTLLACSTPVSGGGDQQKLYIIKEYIDYLIHNEFICLQTVSENDGDEVHYLATPLGRAVLASSLSPDEGLIVYKELEKARRCFVLENELHIIYQVTPIYLTDQWSKLDWVHYYEMWGRLSTDMKLVSSCVGVEEQFLASYARGSHGSKSDVEHTRKRAVHLRFYTALALHDLVNEVPLSVVARKYGCNKGMLQSLQQMAAVFSGMVTVFCHQLGWLNMELLLAQFQNRLHFGVHQELCDLVRLSSLNARRARNLHDAGYKTIAQLAVAVPASIDNVLRNSGPFESAKQKDNENERECTRRLQQRNIWLPGRKGITESEAALLLIQEARDFLEKDLGLNNVNWNIELASKERPDKVKITIPSEISCQRGSASAVDDESALGKCQIDVLAIMEREISLVAKTVNKTRDVPVTMNKSPKNEGLNQTVSGNIFLDRLVNDCMDNMISDKDQHPVNSAESKSARDNDNNEIDESESPAWQTQTPTHFDPRVLVETEFAIDESSSNDSDDGLCIEDSKNKQETMFPNDSLFDRSDLMAQDWCSSINKLKTVGSKKRAIDDKSPIESAAKRLFSPMKRTNPCGETSGNSIELIPPTPSPKSGGVCLSTTVSVTNNNSNNHNNNSSSSSSSSGGGGGGNDVFTPMIVLVNSRKQIISKIPTITRKDNELSSDLSSLSVGSARLTLVTEDQSKFNKFMELWKSKKRFSIAFAAQSKPVVNPIDGRGIGTNIFKDRPTPSKAKSGVQLLPSMRLYEEDIQVMGLAVCWDEDNVYYVSFDLGSNDQVAKKTEIKLCKLIDVVDVISKRLINSAVKKIIVAYDLKEQLKVLYNVFGGLPRNFDGQDPRIAAWLVDVTSADNSYGRLVTTCLSDDFSFLTNGFSESATGSPGLTVTGVHNDGRYRAANEAFLTLKLMDNLLIKLKKEKLLKGFEEIEMPILVPLLKMELNGLGLNEKNFQHSRVLIQARIAELEARCTELLGHALNMSCKSSVAKALYDELQLQSTGDVNTTSLRSTISRRLSVSSASLASPSRFMKRRQKRREDSTSKETLQKLTSLHELPGIILEWRRLQSALIQKVIPITKEKTYHPRLKMYRVYGNSETHTLTGRAVLHLQMVERDFQMESKTSNSNALSQSDKFNLTTVSLRRAFVPFKGGVLVAADYSQLELRVLAHLSEEAHLIRVLNGGADVFKAIASQWKGLTIDEITDDHRQHAKQICYGMIYGIGAKSLSEKLGVSCDEAVAFMDSFKSKYPGIDRYIQSVHDKCRRLGYVETLMGRRRPLPEIDDKDAKRKSKAERQAVNTSIQGTAADIAKLATVAVNKQMESVFPGTNRPLGRSVWHEKLSTSSSMCSSSSPLSPQINDGPPAKGGHFVLHLHDELIYETNCDDANRVAKILKTCMENAVKLSVRLPVKLKIGPTWGDLTEINN